jgi:hypothetical protein
VKTQINKIRDDKRNSPTNTNEISTNTDEIQKIFMEYLENIYSNKLENIEENYKQ